MAPLAAAVYAILFLHKSPRGLCLFVAGGVREQTLARLAAFRSGLARLDAPQVAQTAMFASTEERLDSGGAPVAVSDPSRALAWPRQRCFARCCSTSAPRLVGKRGARTVVAPSWSISRREVLIPII